jgi:hypothetical protein
VSGGFVADVGDPPVGILGMSLQFADGPVELADFFSELEALRGQILFVQMPLGFHLGNVVLDLLQGGALPQRLHAVLPQVLDETGPGVVTLAAQVLAAPLLLGKTGNRPSWLVDVRTRCRAGCPC